MLDLKRGARCLLEKLHHFERGIASRARTFSGADVLRTSPRTGFPCSRSLREISVPGTPVAPTTRIMVASDQGNGRSTGG